MIDFPPAGPPPELPPFGDMMPPPPPPHGPGVPWFVIGILLVGAGLALYFFIVSRRRARRVKELEDVLAAWDEPESREEDPILHFKADYRTVNVDSRKIVYVESWSEYVKIHLEDTEAPVVVLYRLKNLAELLPGGRFLRIHRSYIISLEHIAEASRTSVRLDNGVTLPVSELYRSAFAAYLSRSRS